MLKKLIMGAAIAGVLAAPAFAQSYNPDFGTGNINPPMQATTGKTFPGTGAYAYVPYTHHTRHVRRMRVRHR